MKTEKQIELLTIESAQRCFEEEKSMDKIHISMEKVNSIPELIKDWAEVKTYPILRSGCIIAEKPGMYAHHILFEIRDSGELHIKDVFIVDGVARRCVEYGVEQDKNDPGSVKVLRYADAVMVIWDKQKKSEKMIREYANRAMTDNSAPIDIYLRTMAYINFLLENPQVKQIEHEPETIDRQAEEGKKDEPKERKKNAAQEGGSPKAEIRELQPDANGKPSVPVRKPREIVLNGVRILTSDKKVKSSLVSKKRQRIQTFWTVRGHYRHYQNGKTVYIAPYTKGNKKDGENSSRIRIIKIPDGE